MNALKKKLDSHEIVFATTISEFSWGGVLSRLKSDELDFLILDAEHGHLGTESCEEVIRTCNLLQIPIIVRALDTQYHLMSKYLDFGADGILVPRVETVEQAMSAIEYLRFPPQGKKGCGGSNLLRGEKAFEHFNRNKLIFLQIESPKGAEALEEMLEKGNGEFAGVIVGPTDLSIAMGLPFQWEHPDFTAQIDSVFAICKRRGISCGIYCNSDEDILKWRSKGANILWSGVDVGLFARGYRALCQTIRQVKQEG